MRRLMTFRVGSSRFALPVEIVIEVVESAEIVPTPETGGRWIGVSRIRDRWIPVMDLPDEISTGELAGRTGEDPVLIVLGRGSARIAVRADAFGEVFEESSGIPARNTVGAGVIELPDGLVRRLEPAAVFGPVLDSLENGGPTMNEDTSAEILKVVEFEIGEERFGIDVMEVVEVLKVPEVSALPNSPEFVDGVAEARESVIPVIDMRKRFGLSEAARSLDTRLIAVELDATRVGLIVDAVPGVTELDSSVISSPPDAFKGIAARYLEGIARLDDRLVILLDLGEILTSGEKIELRAMAEELDAGAASAKRKPAKKKD